MTTGQKLVELSGLASGSALAHLLAMQTGGGTGKTIFAAQMTVCMEAPQTTVTKRPSDHSVKTTQHETATAQQDKPNRIAVRTRPARVDVTSRQESIYIAQKTHASTFVRTLPNTLTSRRKRTIKST